MKPFTSEGTNVQEGRQLIRAQSNAEEEAPLGLSLEGIAGARTFSRRQALGLLGGSLAGVTLLSYVLAGPAKSQTLPFGGGDHISLLCQGDEPGARFLDGRTQDPNDPSGSSVGLAPRTSGQYTGTRWEVIMRGTDQISLKCLGKEPGNRYLDGRTQDRTVGLAPHTNPPYTGTRWQVIQSEKADEFILKCLGDRPAGEYYLDGDTLHRTVGLAPSYSGQYTGTRWLVRILPQ